MSKTSIWGIAPHGIRLERNDDQVVADDPGSYLIQAPELDFLPPVDVKEINILRLSSESYTWYPVEGYIILDASGRYLRTLDETGVWNLDASRLSGTGEMKFSAYAFDSRRTFSKKSTFTLPVKDYPEGFRFILVELEEDTTGPGISIILEAAGGKEPYTYSFVGNPTIPSGLGIDPDTGVSTGTLSNSAVGEWSVFGVCEDADGMVISVPLEFEIHAQPLEIEVTTNGQIGLSYGFQASASGGIAPYTYSMDDSIPGIGINSSTGVMTGAFLDSCDQTVTFTVTDSRGMTADTEFRVQMNMPVSMTTDPYVGPVESENWSSFNWQFAASGGLKPYTFTLDGYHYGDPANYSLDQAAFYSQFSITPDGVLSIGNPVINGSTSLDFFEIKVKVTDDEGSTDSRWFFIPFSPQAAIHEHLVEVPGVPYASPDDTWYSGVAGSNPGDASAAKYRNSEGAYAWNQPYVTGGPMDTIARAFYPTPVCWNWKDSPFQWPGYPDSMSSWWMGKYTFPLWFLANRSPIIGEQLFPTPQKVTGIYMYNTPSASGMNIMEVWTLSGGVWTKAGEQTYTNYGSQVAFYSIIPRTMAFTPVICEGVRIKSQQYTGSAFLFHINVHVDPDYTGV